MNYLKALKDRSIFLWRSLFGGEETADEEQPVYIERASVPGGGMDAQAEGRSAPAVGAGQAEPGTAGDRDGPKQEEKSVYEGASGTNLAVVSARQRGAAEAAALEEKEPKPVVLRDITETAPAVVSARQPETAEETASEQKESEPVQQESVLRGITETGSAAASAGRSIPVKEPEPAPREFVLRGIAETELAAVSVRQSNSTDIGSTGRKQTAEQGSTARDRTRPDDPALSDIQIRTGGGLVAAGAKELLLRVHAAERSGSAAERSTPLTAAAPSVRTEQTQAAGPADVSAWFEKDARRYDGAYELM